jgi:hypothetical protein
MGHLDESEAVVAATIDAHRDGVQHQGADVTEERLYIDAASGLRLFDELMYRGFGERLADHPAFAGRMLPIAANPPRELHVLTSNDVEHVRDLLKPPQRRRAEAHAFLRTLMLSEQVASDPMDDVQQPTERQVERFARKLQKEPDWTQLLPGLARLTLEEDEGVTYNLRVVKRGDVPPVRVVKPGEEGAEDAVSLLKYNELDRYPFYMKDLKAQTELNMYEVLALVHLLDVKNDERSFKSFQMGKQRHDRYSHTALKALRDARDAGRLDEAKQSLSQARREKRQRGA